MEDAAAMKQVTAMKETTGTMKQTTGTMKRALRTAQAAEAQQEPVTPATVRPAKGRTGARTGRSTSAKGRNAQPRKAQAPESSRSHAPEPRHSATTNLEFRNAGAEDSRSCRASEQGPPGKSCAPALNRPPGVPQLAGRRRKPGLPRVVGIRRLAAVRGGAGASGLRGVPPLAGVRCPGGDRRLEEVRRPVRSRRPLVTARAAVHDAGMVTSEYAVGVVAAVGFAGVLYKVVTSSAVRALLEGVVERALDVPF